MDQQKGYSLKKKFAKDFGIYAIGNIGSKLVTFMLVPLYTYFITNPADFGYYDICMTIAFCLVPVVSLQFTEGSFRFLINEKSAQSRSAVITYVWVTLIRNSVILLLLGIVIDCIVDIRFLSYIVLFGISQTFFDVHLQIARGLKRTDVFVQASMMNAFSIAVFSVLTVVILRMGIEGILISNICARFLSLAFMTVRLELFKKYLSMKSLNKTVKTDLLKYSIPLLPMAMAWWVLNSNNLFFIKHFLGLEENGIYAVLAKFTSILYVLANIFYQTWQQNALENYHSENRDQFFTNVFNSYVYILCVLAALFPFAVRLNYFWLVSPEYESSAQYLFINSIVIVSFALAAFFELGYQCAKKTRRLLPSIFLAAIINMALNYFLVRHIGLYGIIFSSIITFQTLFIYRWIDTKKYMKVRFNTDNLPAIVILVVSGFLYSGNSGVAWDIGCIALTSILLIIAMPKMIRQNFLKMLPCKRYRQLK